MLATIAKATAVPGGRAEWRQGEEPAPLSGASIRSDGAISKDGQILATYCHGLFDHPDALGALLRWAGRAEGGAAPFFLEVDPLARREADLDRLADAVESAIDWSRLDCPIRPPARS
jgi:adenosylcobyric acid synthase